MDRWRCPMGANNPKRSVRCPFSRAGSARGVIVAEYPVKRRSRSWLAWPLRARRLFILAFIVVAGYSPRQRFARSVATGCTPFPNSLRLAAWAATGLYRVIPQMWNRIPLVSVLIGIRIQGVPEILELGMSVSDDRIPFEEGSHYIQRHSCCLAPTSRST